MSMYLSDLFDGLKGIEEWWEEVGKDRQEVDDVHEAFYELPPGDHHGGDYQIEHVVRGDTNADVLEAMEHKPQVLLERLRRSSEQAVQSGNLSIMDAQRLIRHIENSLRQTTYLQD